MKIDQLVIGETYYTNFGSLSIQNLKLDKILCETENDNVVKVIVKSFPKKAKEKNLDSWQLWSDEIFLTRKEATNNKVK